MAYADLFIGILIIVLLVIAGYHALSSGDQFGRRLWRDDRGKLIAVGERERAAGQISGRGTETSAALQLAAGMYRIDYQFGTLTRLALIDANGDETLLIKAGIGSEPITIPETGRYLLLVEPNDEGASWTIAYRQTGGNKPTL